MGVNIVLSSPSGAGKTTITKKLSQKYPNIRISISHTTRKPRPNEIDGVDYFFVNGDEFEKLIKKDNFYEYAKIFNNYYGTSKKLVEDFIKKDFDVVFDIDWQGTKKTITIQRAKFNKNFYLTSKQIRIRKKVNQQKSRHKPNCRPKIKTI